MRSSSPWRLRTHQEHSELRGNCKADVLIVGGGIAGAMTAKFLLEQTRHRIVLTEAKCVAAGATGNNAGLVVNGFESGIPDLAERFGTRRISEALNASNRGLRIIRAVLTAQGDEFAAQRIPYNIFYCNGNLARQHEIQVTQSNAIVKKQFMFEHFRQDPSRPPIPEVCVPQSICRFGHCLLINPALFVENLVTTLVQQYRRRLRVFEHSPVCKIRKARVGFRATIRNFNIDSQSVVLCTNAYPLDQNICQLMSRLRPVRESLEGHFSLRAGMRSAWGLYCSKNEDDFIYGNTREFEGRMLTVLGGTTRDLGKVANSSRIARWFGTQGYTDTGIRYIMESPKASGFFVNVGCNGIGMALATFGGERIARLIQGERFEGSIFDASVPPRN